MNNRMHPPYLFYRLSNRLSPIARLLLALSISLIALFLAGVWLSMPVRQAEARRFEPAQPVAAISQDRDNRQPVRSAETERRFTELIEKARDNGSVRVIVGLRLPVAYQAEGNLARRQDRDSQRRFIAQAQEALLSRLSGVAPDTVKRFEYIPFMALKVDADVLEQLRASADVYHIQEQKILRPTLNISVRTVGADAAWAAGFTGNGQSVAILDTGVDSNHAMHTGKVVSEACYSTNDGTNAESLCPGGVTNSTAAGSGRECSGTGINNRCEHGTHVAGIAAGRAAVTAGGQTITGVARAADIIAIQVFSRLNRDMDCGGDPGSAPCLGAYDPDIISGLQRVHALAQMMSGGAPVFRIAAVNMSLGDDERNTATCDGTNAAMKTAIDNLRSLGIATVISAGNEGHRDGIGYPACISTAVSVGSTDTPGPTEIEPVSGFSNNANFVSLLAPGGSIRSSIPGGGFGFKGGTSMAAPHVTGAWAVYKSSPGHGTDTVAQVLTQFQTTGVPITDTRTPSPTNIVRQRLRLDSALDLTSADLRLAKNDSPDPVIAGTQLTYTLNVTNDGPDAAADVMVSDPLPANTTFFSISAPGWSCTTPAQGVNGLVKCTRPSLADDETSSIGIVVAVDPATPDNTNLVNTATVSTSAFDPNANNSSATAITRVIARADLEVIGKVDTPDPVVTNNPLTYTITVRNNGPSVATGVALNDSLPFGAIFNNCSATGGGVCGGSGQSRMVTFTSLTVGAGATVTIETTANCALADGAVINNDVTITATTIDPSLANNSASATTLARNPPPMITCPSDLEVIATTPGAATAIVTFADPVVTDNCPGVTVVCIPPSGAAFPVGITTVNCTATDSGGATASCGFKVTVWDVCIQDDARKDFILFNSFTGDYKFVHCGVDEFTMIGKGIVEREGCITRLRDDTRVVSASFDRCHIAPKNTGWATIKRRQPDTSFILKDRNILNNSPTCPPVM